MFVSNPRSLVNASDALRDLHKDDVESCWNHENEEELPRDLGEGDRSSDKDDDIGEVKTHHAEGCALAANMSREDLGAVTVVSLGS